MAASLAPAVGLQLLHSSTPETWSPHPNTLTVTQSTHAHLVYPHVTFTISAYSPSSHGK